MNFRNIFEIKLKLKEMSNILEKMSGILDPRIPSFRNNIKRGTLLYYYTLYTPHTPPLVMVPLIRDYCTVL